MQNSDDWVFNCLWWKQSNVIVNNGLNIYYVIIKCYWTYSFEYKY